MANDPRITDVLDASTLNDVPDADILNTVIIALTGTPANWADIDPKLLLNKMVVSNSRPPSQSDIINGLTQIYRDTENHNTYISISGNDWRYLPNKSVSSQRFIGEFSNSSGTITLGEFDATATGVGFGVTSATSLDANISEIRAGDILFVGTKQLTVTSTSFASAQWTVFGSWATTFSTLTFDSTESIYYNRRQLFDITTIWTGSLFRTETADSDIQNLNAGRRFSDYDILQFEFNVNHAATVISKTFASSRDFNLTTDNSIIWIRNVSDTRFRTVGGTGSSTIRLNKIVGMKVN